MNRKHHILISLILIFLASVMNSCIESLHDADFQHNETSGNEADVLDRDVSEQTRRVMILYSAGFNSLSSYLQQDIEDLKTGYIPYSRSNDDVILIYSHLLGPSGKYSEPSSPVLTRLYRISEDEIVTDTVKIYDKGAISASAAHMNAVLTDIKEEFPAKEYGMIFSSHATGYLPVGYYTLSKDYENGILPGVSMMSLSDAPVPVPYVEPQYEEDGPPVKSIGQTLSFATGTKSSYEMDIKDFADAIPMHMSYILFDACLMGGVEVAYQLRDVCDIVAFSQAEVLAEGLNYHTLAGHLLQNATSQPIEVCKDYFIQYDTQTGSSRSATISLVDCGKLNPLAEVCKELFSKYRAKINTLPPSSVQRYYRSNYHWFYDLESILVQAGISKEELASLRSAADECVLYKASTPSFLGSFQIDVFSGFSMFLPSDGGDYLKSYYKTLDWCMATGLVL